MTKDELAKLRKEVRAGYVKHINHQMTDEEFDDYSEKDHLLVAMDRARR